MADLSVSTGRWIRHWRQARGLTLQDLAQRVGCAPSHLSLVENGKRAAKISLIGNVASVLAVRPEDLLREDLPSDRDSLELDLAKAQHSPEYQASGLPVLRNLKSLNDDVLRVLVALHAEVAQHHTIAVATPEDARRANADLRMDMRTRDNYFGEIEELATSILQAVNHGGGPVGERRIHQIAHHLGFSLHTTTTLPHSTRSVSDLRNRRIFLPASGWGGHDPRTITLQTLGHHVLDHRTPIDYADFLRQRVEVNYFAAAVLMNESQATDMLHRAKDGRYLAIEDLRDAFAVSYETAAHRFTNLITHHCGLQVHFLKVHENGRIYKAYENNGVAFPSDHLGAIEGQVACRQWAARQALVTGLEPGLNHYQYTDTPEGTFWALSQTERTSAGTFAVSIGTRFDDAKWFRGRETMDRMKSTCPDPSCCRRAPATLRSKWSGYSWPSASAHAHLLSTLPPGSFPGVDETDVFEFLERQHERTPSDTAADLGPTLPRRQE